MSENKQELEIKVNEISKEITALRSEIQLKQKNKQELENKIAELICPFKIGDKLVRQNYPDKKAVIAKITLNFSGSFRLIIRKIKKNGEFYVNTSVVYECEKWIKDE